MRTGPSLLLAAVSAVPLLPSVPTLWGSAPVVTPSSHLPLRGALLQGALPASFCPPQSERPPALLLRRAPGSGLWPSVPHGPCIAPPAGEAWGRAQSCVSRLSCCSPEGAQNVCWETMKARRRTSPPWPTQKPGGQPASSITLKESPRPPGGPAPKYLSYPTYYKGCGSRYKANFSKLLPRSLRCACPPSPGVPILNPTGLLLWAV